MILAALLVLFALACVAAFLQQPDDGAPSQEEEMVRARRAAFLDFMEAHPKASPRDLVEAWEAMQ